MEPSPGSSSSTSTSKQLGCSASSRLTRCTTAVLRRLAYDGRGNAVVKSEEDIAAAVASLGGYEKGLYAEK